MYKGFPLENYDYQEIAALSNNKQHHKIPVDIVPVIYMNLISIHKN